MMLLSESVPSAAAHTTEPIWLASYPPGVPKTIDPDAYPSLHSMLLQACRHHAERPAFECLSARMTYAQWERDSRAFAAFLKQQASCTIGDRVAISAGREDFRDGRTADASCRRGDHHAL